MAVVDSPRKLTPLQNERVKRIENLGSGFLLYNPDMSYAVVLEKNEDGGWTATCPVLPGCISEGDTKAEALDNIEDAIHLYLRAVKKELAVLKRQGKQIAQVAV